MSKSEWGAVALMVGVLIAFSLPYLQKSREVSRRNQCDFRLVQLAQAVHRTHELRTALPGYRETARAKESQPVAVSWAYPLLPFLGLAPTPEELKEKKFSPERNGKYASVAARVFEKKSSGIPLAPLWCPDVRPDETRPARLHFVANTGLPDALATEQSPADWPANGVWQDRFQPSGSSLKIAEPLSLPNIDQRDGTSTTLLFAENMDAGDWTDTEERLIGFVWQARVVGEGIERDPVIYGINQQRGLRTPAASTSSYAFARPASFHPGGVNVVYCDGHSDFLDERLDYEIFLRIMTVDDSQLQHPGEATLFAEPLRMTIVPPATDEPISAPTENR